MTHVSWFPAVLGSVWADSVVGGAASWLVPALIGLVGVGLTVSVGYYQWRKSQAASAKLERERRAWERERLRLEHGLDLERDRIARESSVEQEEAAERARWARENEQARMRAQTVDEQTAAYRDGLIAVLRNVRILDMARPLDLHDLYVQVRVCEDARRVKYPRTGELTQASSEDPETLLEQVDKEIVAQTRESLSPEQALSRYNRIALIGDPGAGKTTLLRHLALTYASDDARIPIYVELRRYVDSAQDSLIEFASDDCAARYGFAMSTEAFESALERGEAILLLDGLDETLAGGTLETAHDAYRAVAAEIDRIVARYPTVGVAVTCRRAGWQGGLESFSVLEVLDFAWPQERSFIDRWFRSDETKASGLKTMLSRNVRMRSLAANPLLLSLICMVYERELELPERRAELYNRCIEVLLREWDAHRGIKRFSRFTSDRKRDLLEELAWCFHRNGHRYFTEEDLLGHIGSYLPSIDIAPEDARPILEEVTSQYGLLKEQAHGIYGFLHLTLQEYFAAVAANERGETAATHVAENARQPWWEEVALLLAGRMTDASPLLTRVLGGNGGHEQTEDLSHDRLLFAARCLVGTPRVREPGLRESILADTRSLCEETRFAPVANSAARVLAEVGDGDSFDRVLAAVERRGNRIARALLAGIRGVCDVASAERLMAMVTSWEGPTGPAHREALVVIAVARPEGTVELLRGLMDSQDSEVVCHAVEAAGVLAEPALADDVLKVQTRYQAGGARTNFEPGVERTANALVQMGASSAVPALLELTALNGLEQREALLAASRLGGPEVTVRLASEVHDPQIPMLRRLCALTAITTTRNDLDAAPLLAVMADVALPWEFRWLAIENLERSKAAAEDAIRRLHADADRMEIHVATAATLVIWGHRSAIEPVRLAVLDEALPADVAIVDGGKTFRYTQSIARRLGRALHAARDTTVLGPLTARLREELGEGDVVRARTTVSYLAMFGEEEPARLIRAFLETNTRRMLWRQRALLWESTAALATPSTAPGLMESLCREPDLVPGGRRQYLRAIRAIADIASEPEALIAPLTRAVVEYEGTDVGDGCFEILDSLWRGLRR